MRCQVGCADTNRAAFTHSAMTTSDFTALLHDGARADCSVWGELLHNIAFAVLAAAMLTFEAGQHAREIARDLVSLEWLWKIEDDPRSTACIEAAVDYEPLPFEMTTEDFLASTEDLLSCIDLSGSSLTIRPEPDYTSYTVAELRKAAKGLAKGLHLMRRDELLALLA